ncbi:MAG: CoB--CoM heterodisulfide reductase iron-sulfur subunit A family protein [Crenarchaeota archaeon]|nr:CoB--CoM heterodisulfide reductase iron-sulfur subunit A family protein [Thermoproteota archaeon]MDW8033865.1 CoB--CoM heterodisulfide reductase iron-sulfur subunit A family protein [Nitrososphaerota archaeon]
MKKITVLLCTCGSTLLDNIDFNMVSRELSRNPLVKRIEVLDGICKSSIIKNLKLDAAERIVVAACSNRLLEAVFKSLLSFSNVEFVNIREHCAWACREREEATSKAIRLLNGGINKVVRSNPPQSSDCLGIVREAMVVGGGIAGVRCALDIANAGYRVYIIEKEPSIGGIMAQLDKTFPTLDCSICIEGPLLSEAGRNKNIVIIPNSEVVSVKGRVGDFRVLVKLNPTYVDPEKCNGCGECANVCPVYQPNKYDVDLKPVKAIYCPFAQAVPLKYVINKDHCIECGLCMSVCTRAAINLEDKPKMLELNVGAIVVAIGSDLFDPRHKPEYHYGEYDNVITNMEFERIICASGPTGGVLLRRDGKPAKRIAFIQCVGSRESAPGIEECSYYCCAASMKEARLILEHDRDAKVFIFYNELRAFGKGWEDLLYRRCLEDGIVFIRSRPSEIRRSPEGNLIVVYEDTLTSKRGELEVDMVILALGFKPSNRLAKLAAVLGVSVDSQGFIEETNAKFKPLETKVRGVYVAGTCHGPKDIVESAVEGSAAAALVISLFRGGNVRLSEIARILENKCAGCGKCILACQYDAIVREGDKVRVLESICNSCGACISSCPQEAISLGNWGIEQLASQISGMLSD